MSDPPEIRSQESMGNGLTSADIGFSPIPRPRIPINMRRLHKNTDPKRRTGSGNQPLRIKQAGQVGAETADRSLSPGKKSRPISPKKGAFSGSGGEEQSKSKTSGTEASQSQRKKENDALSFRNRMPNASRRASSQRVLTDLETEMLRNGLPIDDSSVSSTQPDRKSNVRPGAGANAKSSTGGGHGGAVLWEPVADDSSDPRAKVVKPGVRGGRAKPSVKPSASRAHSRLANRQRRDALIRSRQRPSGEGGERPRSAESKSRVPPMTVMTAALGAISDKTDFDLFDQLTDGPDVNHTLSSLIVVGQAELSVLGGDESLQVSWGVGTNRFFYNSFGAYREKHELYSTHVKTEAQLDAVINSADAARSSNSLFELRESGLEAFSLANNPFYPFIPASERDLDVRDCQISYPERMHPIRGESKETDLPGSLCFASFENLNKKDIKDEFSILKGCEEYDGFTDSWDPFYQTGDKSVVPEKLTMSMECPAQLTSGWTLASKLVLMVTSDTFTNFRRILSSVVAFYGGELLEASNPFGIRKEGEVPPARKYLPQNVAKGASPQALYFRVNRKGGKSIDVVVIYCFHPVVLASANRDEDTGFLDLSTSSVGSIRSDLFTLCRKGTEVAIFRRSRRPSQYVRLVGCFLRPHSTERYKVVLLKSSGGIGFPMVWRKSSDSETSKPVKHPAMVYTYGSSIPSEASSWIYGLFPVWCSGDSKLLANLLPHTQVMSKSRFPVPYSPPMFAAYRGLTIGEEPTSPSYFEMRDNFLPAVVPAGGYGEDGSWTKCNCNNLKMLEAVFSVRKDQGYILPIAFQRHMYNRLHQPPRLDPRTKKMTGCDLGRSRSDEHHGYPSKSCSGLTFLVNDEKRVISSASVSTEIKNVPAQGVGRNVGPFSIPTPRIDVNQVWKCACPMMRAGGRERFCTPLNPLSQLRMDLHFGDFKLNTRGQKSLTIRGAYLSKATVNSLSCVQYDAVIRSFLACTPEDYSGLVPMMYHGIFGYVNRSSAVDLAYLALRARFVDSANYPTGISAGGRVLTLIGGVPYTARSSFFGCHEFTCLLMAYLNGHLFAEEIEVQYNGAAPEKNDWKDLLRNEDSTDWTLTPNYFVSERRTS